MKNFMREREQQNRAAEPTGLIHVSGLSDKIPPGEFVEWAGSHWGYPQSIRGTLQESLNFLLMDVIELSQWLWIDHYKKYDLILFSKLVK